MAKKAKTTTIEHRLEETTTPLPEQIESSPDISMRGHRVLLDEQLAALYGIETKVLTRAVRRNIDRFPDDFMFQLSQDEFELLRCQIGTSSAWGGRRYRPLVFTEQGVAMLSSVLRRELKGSGFNSCN